MVRDDKAEKRQSSYFYEVLTLNLPFYIKTEKVTHVYIGQNIVQEVDHL